MSKSKMIFDEIGTADTKSQHVQSKKEEPVSEDAEA